MNPNFSDGLLVGEILRNDTYGERR
jgi:hypothetical protein